MANPEDISSSSITVGQQSGGSIGSWLAQIDAFALDYTPGIKIMRTWLGGGVGAYNNTQTSNVYNRYIYDTSSGVNAYRDGNITSLDGVMDTTQNLKFSQGGSTNSSGEINSYLFNTNDFNFKSYATAADYNYSYGGISASDMARYSPSITNVKILSSMRFWGGSGETTWIPNHYWAEIGTDVSVVPLAKSGLDYYDFAIENNYVYVSAGSYNKLYKSTNTANNMDTLEATDGKFAINDNSIWLVAPYNTSNWSGDNSVGIGDTLPDGSSNGNAGATVTANLAATYCPVKYKFSFTKMTVKLSRNKNVITITSNHTPQNGYYVTLDGNFYSVIHTNTITIPTKYMVGNHVWKVYALCDTHVSNVNINTTIGTLKNESGTWSIPAGYAISGTAYLESDTATLEYSLNLDTPLITSYNKEALDSYSFKWKSVDNAIGYQVSYDGIVWVTLDTNTLAHTFTDMPLGKSSLRVKAIYSDTTYNSASDSQDVVLTRLDAPAGLSFNRTSYNGGTLSWNRVQDAKGKGEIGAYSVSYNGVTYETNDISYTITNLALGVTDIEVRANYATNRDFDSDDSFTTVTMTQLSKPTVTVKKNLNEHNGVESITFTWNEVAYAQDYVIRETYSYSDSDTNLQTKELFHDNDEYSFTITQDLLNNAVGEHIFQVNARAKGIGASDYDSDYSDITNDLDINVKVLKAPNIDWLSNTTGKRKDESTLTWLTPIDEDDADNIPDYYKINMVANSGKQITAGTVVNSDNNLIDVTTLEPTPTQSDKYVLTIYPYSYNVLYYQTAASSVSNNKEYEVIQLGKPDNLVYDYNTRTLSWDAIDNANIYYMYEFRDGKDPQLWTAQSETSYTFEHDLGGGLHFFFVIAGRITEED